MTKKQRMIEFYARAERYGIAFEDVETLRKIEMTLHHWSEEECNGTIQRDGENGDGKPFRYYQNYRGEMEKSRLPIPDRERSALKRLAVIMQKYPNFVPYNQGDPRGCALYLVPADMLKGGKDIDSYYSQGFAICY